MVRMCPTGDAGPTRNGRACRRRHGGAAARAPVAPPRAVPRPTAHAARPGRAPFAPTRGALRKNRSAKHARLRQQQYPHRV